MSADGSALPERLVVDASVAAKWLQPEIDTDDAVALLDREDVELHAPELWTAELGSVLWKRVRRGELDPAEAVEAIELVATTPVERHAHDPIAAPAMVLALGSGVTFYDALYVALARSLGARLVTADRRLAAAAASQGWLVGMLGVV